MNITAEQPKTEIILLTFSEALIHLEHGQHIARQGWNGKGMWLEYVSNEGLMYKQYPLLPFIGMKTADNKFVPWLASQTDILAKDWIIV
jgi:hypothetical protein